MTPRKIINYLLEKEIGVSERAIGSGNLDMALARRMAFQRIETDEEYLDFIHAHPRELSELVELTVVSETWFFRHLGAFEYLAFHTRKEMDAEGSRPLRILSIPCSTGEEPYSIAMTLSDAGLNSSDFFIDALDVSRSALECAESGIFTAGSFRGKDLAYRDRFFLSAGDHFIISPSLRDRVRFIRGNLMDQNLLAGVPPYPVIFCRNLLIYLSPASKKRAVNILNRLLTEQGVLFVGHAEQEAVNEPEFERIPWPRAFACRKKGKDEEVRPRKSKMGKAASPPEVRALPPKKAPLPTPSVLQEAPTPAPKLKRPPKPLQTSQAERQVRTLEQVKHLADRGKLDDAFVHCRLFLNDHPGDADAHFLMAVIYQAAGNETRAEKFLEKALYLNPDHGDALELWMLIAEHRKDGLRTEQCRRRLERIRSREMIS